MPSEQSWESNNALWKLIKRWKRKIDVNKMKRGFSIKQCMYALLECPQDVNEITKKHTEAVSGDICVISLFLQNLILLGVTWSFGR